MLKLWACLLLTCAAQAVPFYSDEDSSAEDISSSSNSFR